MCIIVTTTTTTSIITVHVPGTRGRDHQGRDSPYSKRPTNRGNVRSETPEGAFTGVHRSLPMFTDFSCL